MGYVPHNGIPCLQTWEDVNGGDLLDAPEWTDRKEAGQIEHTQHDPRHFSIALALAEYVTGLRRV